MTNKLYFMEDLNMYEKATKMRDTINELRDMCVAEISKDLFTNEVDVNTDGLKAM